MDYKKSSLSPNWHFLMRESALILIWVYVIVVAGTITGLINFRIHVFSAVLGGIMLGVWVIRYVVQSRKISKSGFDLGLIILLGTQLLAMIFSEDFRRSAASMAVLISAILIFYFILEKVRHQWSPEMLIRTLLITGGIVVGLALFEYFQNYLSWRQIAQSVSYPPTFDYRLYAVFGEANLLAAFVNLLLPLALCQVFSTKNKAARILVGLMVFANLSIVYFSSSRGGLLASLAAIFIFCMGWFWYVSDRARSMAEKVWKFLRSRFFLLGVILLVGVALAIWVMLPLLSIRGDATHGPLLQSRTLFWSAVWKTFLSSPWLGIGPGVYPSAYLQFNEIPPDRPYLHAHSVPMNILAESGLIGFLGAAIFFGVLLRKLWGSRKGLKFAQRARWVAISASLVGVSVHSLVDNFLPYPSVSLVIIVFVAILISQAKHADSEIENSPNNSFSVWCLVLPGICVLGFFAYSLRAYLDSERAVNAAWAGDWQTTSVEFDNAIDHDPGLGLYWFEQGYTQGVLAAQGNDDALTKSIAFYERGLSHEPHYSLHYANLSALTWQAGDHNSAIARLEHAIEQAPHMPIFYFNLGIYHETLGDFESATQAYRQTLSLQPELAVSDFWRQSEFRREMLSVWKDANVADTPPQNDLELGKAALESGDFAAAESYLESAWKRKNRSISLYVALAELAHGRDKLDEAEGYLQAALWLQNPKSNKAKVLPLLMLAEIKLERGDPLQALVYFQQVYVAVTDTTIYGWGTKGWDPYAWFVFQRRSLPVDLLPQLDRLPLTPELIKRLMPLADLYEKMGEQVKSDEVIRTLNNSSSIP